MRGLFPFLDIFGQLRTSSRIFGNDRVTFKKSQHSKDNNLMLISQKKLAGIHKVPYKGRPPKVSGRNRKQSRYRHRQAYKIQRSTEANSILFIYIKEKTKIQTEASLTIK